MTINVSSLCKKLVTVGGSVYVNNSQVFFYISLLMTSGDL